MKRLLTVALVLSLILSSPLWSSLYAQTKDFTPEELEQLMQTALPLQIERLQLQDYSYQHSGNMIYDDYCLANFYFTHNSDPALNIDIALNRRGELVNYNLPSQSFSYSNELHFPTTSRAEIIAIAETFIAQCLPEIANEIGELSSLSIGRNKQAMLRYQRQIMGVPVAADELYLQINLESHRVIQMRRWGSYDLELLDMPFDDDVDLITALEVAWDAIYDQVGLNLRYALRFDQSNYNLPPRIVLEYAWAKESFQLDAHSGNLVDVSIPEHDAPHPHYVRPPYSSSPIINEAQLQALFPAATPLSPEKATEMLKSLPGIDINGFSLSDSSYHHDSSSGQTELWLRFSPSEIEAEPQAYYWIVAAFSVDDRSLIHFNCQLPPSTQGDSWTDSQLRERADAFISNAAPERFESLLWDQNYSPYEKTRGFQEYRYLRQLNGLPFISNATALQLNEYTGAIHSYYSFWDPVHDVPSPEPKFSTSDIYALFKKEMPLQLVYSVKAVHQASENDEALEKWQARLVYENPQLAAAVIDAHSGKRYDYIYSADDEGLREYSDLTDHPLKEQLQQTASFLNLPVEDRFRPEDTINQGEFLQWLYCLQEYSYPNRTLEEIYWEMIYQKVIEARQQEPQRRLQQWEGVLYLMRRLGYGKIEKIDANVYRSHDGSTQLSGHASAYITLADKFGWIDSSFQAEAELSRAEALMMIYRYLSR